jgi:hypothetical protein
MNELTAQQRLLTALKGLENRSEDLALLSAEEAGDIVRIAGCRWVDVISGVGRDEHLKLAQLLEVAAGRGPKAERCAAVKATLEGLKSRRLAWPSLIRIPDAPPRSDPLAPETVRIETTCLKSGQRFYSVARRTSLALERFAVQPIEVHGFLDRPPPAAVGPMHNFHGRIDTAVDWPGCAFCGAKGWVKHECRTGALIFCDGGMTKHKDLSTGKCPLCNEVLRAGYVSVTELSTEAVAASARPQPSAGPSLPGPSALRLPWRRR